jgi:surface protein
LKKRRLSVCTAFHCIAFIAFVTLTQTRKMPVVAVSTLGGGDIAIPFPDGMPLTTGDLVRELATRVPNHRSTFLLCVNDAERPVEGSAADADLTDMVDTTKDVTLLFQPYEAFATDSELNTAVGEWVAGGDRKAVVSERYGPQIGAWDVSKVTDMRDVFRGESEFNDDISGWDTSSVTNMRGMFWSATAFNGDVSGWDTSHVTNMNYMFYCAFSFNGDINGWDTSRVTSMCQMFHSATAFNGDVSGWDTSTVTTMSYMFYNAHAFNGNVSGWDVSNVTDMRNMFCDTGAFNGDVSGWDTSNVTSMSNMFSNARAFNSDISGWNMSNVTDTRYMFHGATAFQQRRQRLGHVQRHREPPAISVSDAL